MLCEWGNYGIGVGPYISRMKYSTSFRKCHRMEKICAEDDRASPYWKISIYVGCSCIEKKRLIGRYGGGGEMQEERGARAQC